MLFDKLSKDHRDEIDEVVCFDSIQVTIRFGIIQVIAIDQSYVLLTFNYCWTKVFVALNDHKVISLL